MIYQIILILLPILACFWGKNTRMQLILQHHTHASQLPFALVRIDQFIHTHTHDIPTRAKGSWEACV